MPDNQPPISPLLKELMSGMGKNFSMYSHDPLSRTLNRALEMGPINKDTKITIEVVIKLPEES